MVCLNFVLLHREHMCSPPTSRPTPFWYAPTYSHEQVNEYHPGPTVSQHSMIQQPNGKQALMRYIPRWSSHVVVRSCGWWVAWPSGHYSQTLSYNKFTTSQGNLHISACLYREERRREQEDTFDGTRHASTVDDCRLQSESRFFRAKPKPWNHKKIGAAVESSAVSRLCDVEALLHLQTNTWKYLQWIPNSFPWRLEKRLNILWSSLRSYGLFEGPIWSGENSERICGAACQAIWSWFALVNRSYQIIKGEEIAAAYHLSGSERNISPGYRTFWLSNFWKSEQDTGQYPGWSGGYPPSVTRIKISILHGWLWAVTHTSIWRFGS